MGDQPIDGSQKESLHISLLEQEIGRSLAFSTFHISVLYNSTEITYQSLLSLHTLAPLALLSMALICIIS